jgi:hypothetical protein
MEWIRYHPKISAVVAGIITLLVIVFVWMQISPDDNDEQDPLGIPTLSPPTTTPLTELPTESPSASPTGTATGAAAGGPGGAFEGFGGAGSGGGKGSGGTLEMPGLQGGSMYKYLPKHKIVLRVTSEVPIGTIGYVMPTSLRHSSGTVKNAGTSWSLTDTVYGNPDYAQLFFQAGSRGFPVTCTITVDGRVTERRSTEGPYGQMVCQG